MRVVLDTNVLISAIVFGGNPERILLEIHKKGYALLVSPAILVELARILRKKLMWQEDKILFALEGLKKLHTLVTPTIKIQKIHSDPSDNRILECAVFGKADYIVTGDKKHLLPLKKFSGIPILSPKEFLQKVLYN